MKNRIETQFIMLLTLLSSTNDKSTLVMLNRHSALDAEQHLHIIRRLRVIVRLGSLTKPAMTFGYYLRLFDCKSSPFAMTTNAVTVNAGNLIELQTEISTYGSATENVTINVATPVSVTVNLTVPVNTGGYILTITGAQLTRSVTDRLITKRSNAELFLENIIIDGRHAAAVMQTRLM